MIDLDEKISANSTFVVTRYLPRVVYYSSDHSDTPVCNKETQELFKCTYTLPTNWHTLVEELETGPDFLLIKAADIVKSLSTVLEFVGMMETLIKFIPASKCIHMGVVINKDTPLSVVKELQKTSVMGLLLDINDFPITDVLNSNNSFLLGMKFWPKHIIETLPGNIKKLPKRAELYLTERQTEVLNLICNRGLSNKQIAKYLNISESTVKIHVSAIMKVYAVRNRTQLALIAKSSNK